MKQVTQKKLKELLHYNELTGVFTWLVRGKAGDLADCLKRDGYKYISVCGKIYLSHRLAWLYVHGYFPEQQIDHIDRIRNNNAIANLREVSRACNARNTGNFSNNTSGVKGVCWDKQMNKWKAKIKINGRTIYLGYHDDISEAACHRLAAEQAENWEGCDSSSPAFQYVKKSLSNETSGSV